MDTAAADAYLERIEAVRPAFPDADALRTLQLSHLRAVPFENLAIHLGEEIVLAEQPLLDKIVGARRGGFCYELNGAFAALLGALGYDVELLSARVFGPDGLGIPYDHLALRVRTPDGPLLTDVGFGKHSHYPLRLDSRSDQTDPGGVFRIEEAPRAAPGARAAAKATATATAIWMSTVTESRSTASNNGRVCSPTSGRAAGGTAPRPRPISRRA